MKNADFDQTIAATATPLGHSGIGIVRISGPDCLAISQTIFRPAKASHPLQSHRLCYGDVIDPLDGHMVDEALVVYMRAPLTYTREDCLEIQAHGGMTVLQEILHIILKQNVRLARPGEFTLRAFLNGRIDLPQAEAVADIIQAKSHKSLELARRQLCGRLSLKLQGAKEMLLDTLALLEAAIDFPEDDIPTVDNPEIFESLDQIASKLNDLAGTYDKGKLCKEGASMMIIGAPNAGKSSLLNTLVGFERVIVTDIPGTTRDIVEESMDWKGLPIRAIDTAGLRDPRDPIEAQGHRLLSERVRQVDLIIWVIDSSRPLNPSELESEDLIQGTPCIVALNKIDLAQCLSDQDLPASLRSYPVVQISAKNGTNIEALLDTARDLLLGSTGEEDFLLTSMRHKLLLDEALGFVNSAAQEMKRSGYIELAAADLHDAFQRIQELLGEKVDDEILSRIFDRFCIGK